MKKAVGNTSLSGLCAAVAAVALLFAPVTGNAGMLDGLWKKGPAAAAKAAGVAESPDAVRIPLKSLDSGKALFLETEAGGKPVRYFALRSGDGKYRAALDACDVCFRSGKGYSQQEDRMVCNNCGMTFASNRIGDKKGGCNPHPLAHKVEGGWMIVARSDLAAGAGYFPGNPR